MQGPKFQVPWAYVYRQRNARETKYKSAPFLSDSSDRSGEKSGATHSKKTGMHFLRDDGLIT